MSVRDATDQTPLDVRKATQAMVDDVMRDAIYCAVCVVATGEANLSETTGDSVRAFLVGVRSCK